MWKSLAARPQDPPLSQLGRAQALGLGKAIGAKGLSVSRIFSSPFVRCIQTSDLAATGFKVAPDASIIAVEEGLCEECCSFRLPAAPYFLKRLDLRAVSSRVDLSYDSATRVVFEDMSTLSALAPDSAQSEPAGTFAPVRDLVAMGKSDNMPLTGDPERHFVREVCEELPNPFDTRVPTDEYRACCRAFQLPGPVAGHPGWEVTFLRIRRTLERLGFVAPKAQVQRKPATATSANEGETEPSSSNVDGIGESARWVKSEDGSDNESAVLLVTHGACNNILFEILTGAPPSKMATVGSYFLLERPIQGSHLWRDLSGGVASTEHISVKGNAAH